MSNLPSVTNGFPTLKASHLSHQCDAFSVGTIYHSERQVFNLPLSKTPLSATNPSSQTAS
ncbi:MAG: hypothetical protein ACR2MD_17405 [Aridibacter sp.]